MKRPNKAYSYSKEDISEKESFFYRSTHLNISNLTQIFNFFSTEIYHGMKEIQRFLYAFQEMHSDTNVKNGNIGFRAFRADQSRMLVASSALGEELA